jgi:hypothetical protein
VSDVYKGLLGSIVRSLLMALSAVLVTRHLLGAKPDDAILTTIANNIVDVLPGVAAQLWSFWQKWYQAKLAHTALQAAPGTNMDVVRNKVRMGFGAVLPVLFVCAALTSMTACASNGGLTKKQTITLEVLKPSHDVLANFQDAEIAIYNQHSVAQLTPERHRNIEGLLGTAFRDHAKATRAVQVWRAGDPVPTSIAEFQRDVDDVLKLVKDTFPQSSSLVSLIQQVVNEATKISSMFKGGI